MMEHESRIQNDIFWDRTQMFRTRGGWWGEAKRFCLCDSRVRCGCCREARGGINKGWWRRSRWWWGWPWWVTSPVIESPRSERYLVLQLPSDNFPDHSYPYYLYPFWFRRVSWIFRFLAVSLDSERFQCFQHLEAALNANCLHRHFVFCLLVFNSVYVYTYHTIPYI